MMKRSCTSEQIEAIIFDFDGTLASSPYDYAAIRRAVWLVARDFGIAQSQLSGLGILEAMERGIQLLSDDPAAASRFSLAAQKVVTDMEVAAARQGDLLPGALIALARLRELGLKIAVVSRNCRKAVDLVLKGRKLPCETLLTREDVGRAKPDPEHLQTALDQLDSKPEQTVMVGDHVWDIAAGKALGLLTLGVTTGSASAADLLAAGADAILPSVADLPDWLEGRTLAATSRKGAP